MEYEEIIEGLSQFGLSMIPVCTLIGFMYIIVVTIDRHKLKIQRLRRALNENSS